MSHFIATKKQDHVLEIFLNRKEKLNALNLEMIQGISLALDVAQKDETISCVDFKSTCERAFCAGADVKIFATDPIKALELVRAEYTMNKRLLHFPKKTRAFVDGLVMGGGVGIAFYTDEIIATKKMVFAMPEVKIGFFPDVGMSYRLPRLKKRVGWYLAMTGNSINAADCAACGLIDNGDFGEPSLDFDMIDKDFSSLSVDEIKKKYAITASFQSVQIAYELMLAGKNFSSVEEALDFDLILAQWFLSYGDVAEGVRCLLIEKGKTPSWRDSEEGVVKRLLSLVQ